MHVNARKINKIRERLRWKWVSNRFKMYCIRNEANVKYMRNEIEKKPEKARKLSM